MNAFLLIAGLMLAEVPDPPRIEAPDPPRIDAPIKFNLAALQEVAPSRPFAPANMPTAVVGVATFSGIVPQPARVIPTIGVRVVGPVRGWSSSATGSQC